MKAVLVVLLTLSWVFFLATGWPDFSTPPEPSSEKVIISKADTRSLEKEIQKLKTELKTARQTLENFSDLQTQLVLVEEERDRWKSEAEDLRKKGFDQPIIASEEAQTSSSSAEPEDDDSAKNESTSMAKMMREMMKAEGMEDMVKMQVEQQFNRLWSDFAPGMTPELREVVMDRLKERQLQQALTGMKFFEMSQEEKGDWSQKVKEENEAFENEIETLLGMEYAPLYQDYKTSLPARLQFHTLKQMGYAPGNPETEEKVLKAFVSAQKNVSSHTPEDMPESFDQSSIHQHTDKVLQHQDLLIQEVLIKSKDNLSNAEHADLAHRLEQYRKQMEVGLKMSKMFMGDEDSKEHTTPEETHSPLP